MKTISRDASAGIDERRKTQVGVAHLVVGKRDLGVGVDRPRDHFPFGKEASLDGDLEKNARHQRRDNEGKARDQRWAKNARNYIPIEKYFVFASFDMLN